MIKNDILRGIILEEERVPSTNEFAKLFAINPATAAKMTEASSTQHFVRRANNELEYSRPDFYTNWQKKWDVFNL